MIALGRSALPVRPVLLAMLAVLVGCGSVRLASPLVPTPENAIPHSPPGTSVAPAEIPWPALATRTLANGLRVVVAERPRDHRVSIRLRVLGAGESGPDEGSGLPALVAMMLRRGVLAHDAVGDADADDDPEEAELVWPAASVVSDATYSVGTNHAEISYVLPAQRLDAGLDALVLEATRPAFDRQWFELERSQQLASIASFEADPAEVALTSLATLSFGRDSPFGRSTYGRRSFVETVDTVALDAFHRAHYGPDRSVLIVAGPVDAERVFSAAARAFSGWHAIGDQPAPIDHYDVALVEDGPREVYLEAASDHALVLFAMPYRTATEEDRAAFDVLADAYGGVFDSWLNLALRENDGSLYVASASQIGTTSAGLLVTRVSVAIDRVESAVRQLDAVGRRLAAGRVEASELELVHRQETMSYIDMFADAAQTTRAVASAITAGGELETLRARHEKALAATPADLAAAATHIFDGERTRLLLVGPRATLEPSVERARRGSHADPALSR